MKDSPCGTPTSLRRPSPARPPHKSPTRPPHPSPARPADARGSPRLRGAATPPVSSPAPSDPYRQARRIPIRVLKMLTAHSHLLHPEYLQPLTSAPVSIELDAKKSPLALLAQTCSQIGKPDPPSSSKLASLSSGGLGDKDSSSGRSSKSGEPHQATDDKSSFKPYAKLTGECRKDAGLSKGPSDRSGFRVPGAGGTNGSNASCPSFTPRTRSPCSSSSPPLHSQSLPHRQSQSPGTPQPAAQAPHTDSRPGPPEQASSDRSSDSGSSGGGGGGGGGGGKKDSDPRTAGGDGAQLANSSHVRASANSSNASSACSPRPDSKPSPQASTPGPGPGHVAPVSPFKPGHSVFPMPPASMGYHGSIVGAYAGYPSHFMSGMDHSKAGMGLGLQRKTPSSSPLSGASPPSLMQGLCRDPYCLTYPSAAHLGGSGCSTCVHDPSASLKSGFPGGLVYPSHHLHPLHPGAMSSGSAPSLSHPLYTYGYLLSGGEPQTHACNWVSAGGPCDKRFSTSEELLAHLRSHTAMHAMGDGKMLSAYPSMSSSSAAAAAAAACHLHLPPPGSPGGMPHGSFSLRGSPGLGLARYHPYAKGHPGLPMHSLPSSPAAAAAAAYYSPYALYSQRLGAASALGYQ